jgi:dipeptidyl aminopeptidase/acylaminoacyl peptidase
VSDFDDFDSYLSLARVTELTLSPDGTRLVATIAQLNADGDKFVSALWELDASGQDDARRLTRSKQGESGARFAPDSSLLFVSKREGADDEPPALWRLPAAGGEAERVLTRPGGVSAVRFGRDSSRAVIVTEQLSSSSDPADDEQRRKARKDLKVAATLHTASPIRYWDHDLGPGEVHLQLLPALDASDGDLTPVELTPAPGRALAETSFVITPDGSTVVTSWNVADEPGYPRPQLVAIDTATGERRVLADDPAMFFEQPAVSPDGGQVVCVRMRDTTYDDPPAYSLWLVDLATGDGRELVADPDLWPGEPQFSADGSSIFFLADEDGHRPVFRLDLATEQITRVTASGHYTNLLVSPDGESLFALRDHVDSPPAPVRLDASGADAEAQPLPAPGTAELPGHIERISTTADDGTKISAWLALPSGTSASKRAPLLLWIHGGPLSSWNSWSWRWNPWLMVARGYAVLLPDPAFSTGYGANMVARGWGQWGGNPFTDLMAITDAAEARPDIDETRTAAMGGSYGGYMANWVAGHTDRFRCIVTHASLWALEQFIGTTDVPAYWAREWGLPTERPERYAQWSPHLFADKIVTPMLVVHGDKDYRVPVGEALRLWWDLQRLGVDSRYLYFPDEGHWVLKPGNARVWYETVWAWLAQHVHGEPWRQPGLL